MAEETSSRRKRFRPLAAVALVLGVLAVGAFVWLVIRAQALPEGPEPVAWDKEACAFCRMHVGDPASAAQAQMASGAVLNFDDPGCLIKWLDTIKEKPRAIYLHHRREDRWLTPEQVGFEEGAVTPMGHGLAAVDAGQPGTLSWEQAVERIRQDGPREH